ncbi:3'-5' exonuclease [Pseudoalteromonas sp. B193]
MKASNALIQNNSERMGKSLWTDGNDGEPISIYAAFNELDEARFVSSKLRSWLNAGNALQDAAILYRSNAQSRVLEEAMLQEGLKYRIYGGMRFFERQEIKDALSYLRLVGNRQDDAAFERVINTPARGIGDKTLEPYTRLCTSRIVTALVCRKSNCRTTAFIWSCFWCSK